MDYRNYTSIGASSEQPSPALSGHKSYTDITGISAPKSYTDITVGGADVLKKSYTDLTANLTTAKPYTVDLTGGMSYSGTYSYQHKDTTPTTYTTTQYTTTEYKPSTEYKPYSYTNDLYSSGYLKEAPKSASIPATTHHQDINLTSYLGSYTTSTIAVKEKKASSTKVKALVDFKDKLRQEQMVIKSSMLTFCGEMQRNIKSLQGEIDRIHRLKSVELGRLKHEKEEIEFQRNALKDDSERLTKKNEELRVSVEQAARNLKRKEDEHQADLEKFKQLYDEMIRNISEEKKRAITRITIELREKGIDYQYKAGGSAQESPVNASETTVTRRSEQQEKVKSSYRHVVEDFETRSSQETEHLARELSEIKALLAAKEKDLELERNIRQEVEVHREKQMKLVEELEKEVEVFRQKTEVTAEGQNKIDIEAYKKQENERVHRYEERIKELEESLKKLSELTNAHHEEVHKADSAREKELRDEVEKLRGQVRSGEHDKEELVRLREQISRLESTQQEEAGASGEVLEKQKSKRRDYKKKYTSVQEELTKEQKEKEDISSKLQAVEKELEKWTGVEEERRRVLEEAQTAVEAEKKEKEGLALKLSGVESKVENLRGKKKEYKTQLSQVQEKIVAGQQEKDTVSDKAKEYEQEIARQNSRLEEFQRLITESQGLAGQEKKNREELVKKVVELEESVNKYRQKKKNYKTRLVDVQGAGAEAGEQSNKQVAALREKNDNLKEDIKQLQENVNKLQSLVENYKEIEENYKSTLSVVKAEAEEAKKKNEELSGLEEKVKKQGEKKREYKKQLSSVQESAVAEKEKMSSLESELHRLKEKQGNYEHEIQDAKKRAEEETHHKTTTLIKSKEEEHEKTLAELRKHIGEADERERKLKEKVSDLEHSREESRTWSEKYKNLETELNNLKAQVEKKEHEVQRLKQEVTGHHESSKTKTEGAEKTIEKLKVELNSAHEAQRKEKSELEEKIKQLQKEVDNAGKAANENKQQNNKKIENEKKQLENNLKEVTNEKNQLEAKYKKELEKVQNELKESHRKLEEAEKSKASAATQESGFVTREHVVEKSRGHEVEGSRFARLNEMGEEKPRRSAPPGLEHDQKDNLHIQRIQELESELASRDQHINALKYDVEQMKEWIVVRHGDEVFEQDSSSDLGVSSKFSNNDEKYEILEKSAGLSEKAEEAIAAGRHSAPTKKGGKKNKNKSKTEKNLNISDKNFQLNWKGRLEDSSVLMYVPKKDSLHVSTAGVGTSEARGNETPRSIKTTESIRTPDSRKGGKGREREGGPAYAQLEKMIMELNEKLAGAEKKSKLELEKKVKDLTFEFQQREEQHAEEIEKMKEERKALEEKLNNIQWDHAFELNNLIKKEQAEREALLAKQTADATPSQSKKKKKNKGGNQ